MVPATSGRLSVLFAGTMGVEWFTGFSSSAFLFPIFISPCTRLGYHGDCADSFFFPSCTPPDIRGPFHVVSGRYVVWDSG